ncbi:hypothetical protein [Pseudoclavibacter endophyticus]|uniref:hypothetical protein n=1 Tax=Pseudoclavibacter endophyticus TaxID=1778590 RepID=UPI001CE4324D|nr:hypothetical protein [Pseudoclavibacter endophyticus]
MPGPTPEQVFDEVWPRWPRKDKRKPALEKFKRLAKTEDIEMIGAAIARFGDAYRETTDAQFVPHLVTWLNQGRWDDELPQARGGNEKRMTHLDVIARMEREEVDRETQRRGEAPAIAELG